MSHSEDQYYKKITSIQQSMYKSEKRRLELERELFAYSKSDKRISQIKCSKLRSYLKEISDREARAKMRNLELLREVECIEISMKKNHPDRGSLQQQKTDVFKKISNFMEARMRREQDAKAAKVKAMQHQDIFFAHTVNTPSPLSLMGQQAPKRSEVVHTRVCSDNTLDCPPKCSMHFHEHLPSGLLKDSRACREDTARNQAYLSDDISGSNNSPDGYNLSDKHEITMAGLPIVCALTDTAKNVPFRSHDEQETSPLVTLTVPEEKPAPSSIVLMGAISPIVEKNEPKELTLQTLVIKAAEKDHKHLVSESTTGQKSLILQGSCKSMLSSEVNLSISNSSAQSISLTQSELDEDLPRSKAADKPEVMEESDNSHQSSVESLFHSDRSDSPSQVILDSLSQKGLFKLLDTIEGQLHCKHTSVYSNLSTDAEELNKIISLCNTGADLNGKDPKACGAVVLHELQRLSWSTAKGCLLPQDLVSAHQSITEPNQVSANLPPDAAQLWDRWFKHALLLKELHVLSTEQLVQLFTPLLLERHAAYSHQAKVLLRTLLSRSSEECPSAEADLCSFGPSPLPDCGVVESLQQQQNQEQQSSEEDSQDESPVESVPIRESKAYKLLKQSAMQDRMLSSKHDEDEEEGGLSGINHDHEEDLGRTKRSLHQDPYPRMERVDSKAHSALQSKALQGASDDSNSEIEEALRPQPFSTNNVDTDDFYD